MTEYEFDKKALVENLSQEELADQLLSYKGLARMYKKDNDSLREENESLRYLIMKYNMH